MGTLTETPWTFVVVFIAMAVVLLVFAVMMWLKAHHHDS